MIKGKYILISALPENMPFACDGLFSYLICNVRSTLLKLFIYACNFSKGSNDNIN